jgi:hypothetical protein
VLSQHEEENLPGRPLQRHHLFRIMKCGRWFRLAELVKLLGAYSETGVSARIRDLRKEKYGGYTVLRRTWKGSPRVFEYRLVLLEKGEATRSRR